MPKKLNLKLQRFVAEYALSGHGEQSAIKAGYAPKSARSKASQLLAQPEIKAQVDKLNEKHLSKIGITKERVAEELAKMAFASLGDFFVEGGDGTPELKPWDELTPDQKAALGEVSVTRGNGESAQVTTRIKLGGKRESLMDLAKLYNLLPKEDPKVALNFNFDPQILSRFHEIARQTKNAVQIENV